MQSLPRSPGLGRGSCSVGCKRTPSAITATGSGVHRVPRREETAAGTARTPLAARARAQHGEQQQGAGGAGREAQQDPRYAYSDPLNQFLGNFLPPARDAASELAHIDWAVPKAEGLPLHKLAERFTREFLRREWFVTGDVPPELFSDAFVFKDDSVATSGIRSYALGVRKLFDQETARAELITVTAAAAGGGEGGAGGGASLTATWRLEGRVNLPLRPTIAPFVVTTTLGLDGRGLVASQLDEFSAPGWRLLAGALLGAWAGPPAAPAAAALRAAAAAAGRPGVVGEEAVAAAAAARGAK
ncbi:MAG: hypothetical protein J3K34DRAFT_492699 [Monoraphidium minutum]|nr:MAG: hypothetical protein J3K34DRAFT_492699 [Monoraphidium minutum]